MSASGATVWFVPDAYLPYPIQADGPYVGHEAICVLNVTDKLAELTLDFYFEDRAPVKGIEITIPAERTRHLRLDKPEQIGGYQVREGVPYAIRITSTVPITVQYSRLDTTQVQATLMTTIAFPLQ